MKCVLSGVVLVVLVGLAGCVGGPDPQPGQTAFTGTVTYVELEGGFYGIVTTYGQKLFPVNLPNAVRQDGLKVSGVYAPAEAQAGIHMWGKRVHIVSIEALRRQ